MSKRALIVSALAAAVAAPSLVMAQGGPAPAPTFKAEKCYGLAKAGKNDCASTGNNSCAGTSKVNADKKACTGATKKQCISKAKATQRQGNQRCNIEQNTEPTHHIFAWVLASAVRVIISEDCFLRFTA